MATVSTLEPQDAREAASMLAQAATDGIALVPHGNRTKLGASPTVRAALVSTSRLTNGLAHYAGDLVATAPAGCTLREVNDALGRERQWIPIDPPFSDRATIGGIVAANDSGPRRHRFGSPRDLIIGIEVALTSGTVAHSGGRVVKNVAGYDLGRLFCGSLGSLGLITTVTFKLAPTAPASCTVVARFDDAQQAAASAATLSASSALTPSTIEIVAPDARLLVRFETTAHSADQMAAAAAAMLAEGSNDVVTLAGDDERAVWAEHQQLESADEGLTATVSVLPAVAGAVIELVERLAAQFGVGWFVTGRAALGVFRVRATGGGPALQQFAVALRADVAGQRGHVQFVGGAEVLGDQFDARGPLGSSAAVALAVKQRFDPAGVLPYPWSRG